MSGNDKELVENFEEVIDMLSKKIKGLTNLKDGHVGTYAVCNLDLFHLVGDDLRYPHSLPVSGKHQLCMCFM